MGYTYLESTLMSTWEAHFVPQQHLISIYHIFASHLFFYGAQVWTQKVNSVSVTLQYSWKVLPKSYLSLSLKLTTKPFAKKLKILKFVDDNDLSSYIFIYDILNEKFPASYVNTFTRIMILSQPVAPGRQE